MKAQHLMILAISGIATKEIQVFDIEAAFCLERKGIKLVDAKYRPINPPVDLLINPLTKPNQSGEVANHAVEVFC